jgi:hypothetical protein
MLQVKLMQIELTHAVVLDVVQWLRLGRCTLFSRGSTSLFLEPLQLLCFPLHFLFLLSHLLAVQFLLKSLLSSLIFGVLDPCHLFKQFFLSVIIPSLPDFIFSILSLGHWALDLSRSRLTRTLLLFLLEFSILFAETVLDTASLH